MKKVFPPVCIIVTLLVVLLGLSGMITIAVGCHASADPFALVWKQFVRLTAGIAAMWTAANIPFDKLKKYSPHFVIFFLMLLYCLLEFGVKINGMRGWFRCGEASFQPSEPGKVFFLLGLVVLLTSEKIRNRSDFWKILCTGVYLLLWLAALLLQPDMGTAAVYAAVFAAVLWLAEIKIRFLLPLFAAGAAAVAGFILTHPYALRRVNGFLNPDTDPLGRNWHLNQLLRTVARGGWTGVKSANAHWSKSYLPFAYNDSVFASVCESVGVIGAFLIPATFILIFYLLIKECEKRNLSTDRQLFVKGAVFMLVFQSFLHISVNIGLAPITGITMFFVSYGGSSMISGCLLLGTVFSAIKTE